MALDTAHAAALDETVIRPVRFAFFDFEGDPLRVTDAPYAFTFAGTDDDDLDGSTFTPLLMQPISVSEVVMNERGADTVTFTLSGINTDADDLDIMNTLGNPALWRGRVVRLWRALFAADLTMIGYPDPYFTGYLSVPTLRFAATGCTIEIKAETYLAYLTSATNRTYLTQADYDSGDLSAEAAIAIANGIEGNALGSSTPPLYIWGMGPLPRPGA